MASPTVLRAANEGPTSLDHIILGCDDLDKGIAFMEERVGVRAAFGGVHPGRGTRNALLSLGAQRYFEIMAPDPGQQMRAMFSGLRKLSEPRLVGWSVHTGDIRTLAGKIRGGGFAIDGPNDGARTRPDGQILRWRLFRLQEDRDGILPFFIEWSRDAVHPSADAPAGCDLVKLWLQSSDPAELEQTLRRLGVDTTVQRGEKAQLCARIAGPKGEVRLTS